MGKRRDKRRKKDRKGASVAFAEIVPGPKPFRQPAPIHGDVGASFTDAMVAKGAVDEAPTLARPEAILAATAEPASPPVGSSSGSSQRPVDFECLAENAAHMIQAGQTVAAAWTKGAEKNAGNTLMIDTIGDAVWTFGQAAEFWLGQPEKLTQAQAVWSGQMVDLWANTLRRFCGEAAAPLISRTPKDKRFADPQWDQPFFDFLRQAHAISSDWMADMLRRTNSLDPRVKAKAGFYLRQIASAASPSNFLLTNPELLRTTLQSNGDNLLRGLRMLAEDVEAGGGQLRLRQADSTNLQVGRDMATTPGKVIFRNDLIELLQYAPATDTVFARPVLVVPPWINKFYILDLNPAKSYVRWMVEQGLTVFMISWVNPDARHADMGLADYMHEGVLAGLDVALRATGSRDASAIGYCVGGTMLSMTLAWLAAHGDRRIANATLFATQTDFTDPGDLGVFTDEATVDRLERHMAAAGTLDGAVMANAFNMLRPDDLIWSYVVNNYVRGVEPPAFDLLSWNSDATRMTRANHAAYLRECYLENRLSRKEMTLDGVRLDLGAIDIPVYSLATKEDHIAPARSVYRGMQGFGGPVRFVLGGSGHIAGVVNPPALGKYQYWAGGPLDGSFTDWLSHAAETKGSWWPDWLAWLTTAASDTVPARMPGEGALPALGDAPGDYVLVKA